MKLIIILSAILSILIGEKSFSQRSFTSFDLARLKLLSAQSSYLAGESTEMKELQLLFMTTDLLPLSHQVDKSKLGEGDRVFPVYIDKPNTELEFLRGFLVEKILNGVKRYFLAESHWDQPGVGEFKEIEVSKLQNLYFTNKEGSPLTPEFKVGEKFEFHEHFIGELGATKLTQRLIGFNPYRKKFFLVYVEDGYVPGLATKTDLGTRKPKLVESIKEAVRIISCEKLL